MKVKTNNITYRKTEPNRRFSDFLLGSLFFKQYTKWLLMQ